MFQLDRAPIGHYLHPTSWNRLVNAFEQSWRTWESDFKFLKSFKPLRRSIWDIESKTFILKSKLPKETFKIKVSIWNFQVKTSKPFEIFAKSFDDLRREYSRIHSKTFTLESVLFLNSLRGWFPSWGDLQKFNKTLLLI